MNVYRVPNSPVGVEMAKMMAFWLTASIYKPQAEIVEVAPPAKDEDGAEPIRAIIAAYKYAPQGHAKTLIVHRPDLLSNGAQNALRKTIEDTPTYLHVILVSNTEWR